MKSSEASASNTRLNRKNETHNICSHSLAFGGGSPKITSRVDCGLRPRSDSALPVVRAAGLHSFTSSSS